jgi:hypothetical protein
MPDLQRVHVNLRHGQQSEVREYYFARVPTIGEMIQTHDRAMFYTVQAVSFFAYDGPNAGNTVAVIDVEPTDPPANSPIFR